MKGSLTLMRAVVGAGEVFLDGDASKAADVQFIIFVGNGVIFTTLSVKCLPSTHRRPSLMSINNVISGQSEKVSGDVKLHFPRPHFDMNSSIRPYLYK
jgi:hypothetical protein